MNMGFLCPWPYPSVLAASNMVSPLFLFSWKDDVIMCFLCNIKAKSVGHAPLAFAVGPRSCFGTFVMMEDISIIVMLSKF